MEKFISLDGLKHGAVLEKFNLEFGNVISNLLDPNTDWKKARKIALVLELKINEEREDAEVHCIVKSSLQPSKPVITRVLMAQGEDAVQAKESVSESISSSAMTVDPVTGEVRGCIQEESMVLFERKMR